MSGASALSLARHGDTIGLALAIAVLAVALGLGFESTRVLASNSSWVEHTHRVIETLDQVMIGTSGAISARRGFALTGDQRQLDVYAKAVELMTKALASVRTLTADHSGQQRRLDALAPLIAARISRLDHAIADRSRLGFDLGREARHTLEGTVAFDEIWRRAVEMATEERRLLGLRERRTARSEAWTKGLEAAGGTISLLLVTVVVLRLRREVRQRERSEQAVRSSEAAVKRLNEGLDRRVAERTSELRVANAELESFGYAVVHHLRAPLRGMGGFAEILLEDHSAELSASARDSLSEIRANAAQMAALIDALVSMSGVTRCELLRREVDLTKVTHHVVAELGRNTSPVRIVRVQEGLHACVDASLVRTLLEILIGNAWKFTARLATANIEVGQTELDGERAWFVRDDGAGLDMAHEAKLFAPFGRLHTVEEFPGLGIGLATALRIVQRHGGRIWANGKVGEGAVFYFTLSPKLTEGSI
ncbi:MAG: Bacteriophytochrome [Myxococcaceae bacterium]|nr:Bacteriophytochrome [Myxococcaceae bacterium]